MSSEKRTLRSSFDGFGGELLGAARGTVADEVDRAYSDGFNDAANLCVNLVAAKAAALMARITSGSLLSSDEQVLLASLTGLKEEMERELHAHSEDETADRRLS